MPTVLEITLQTDRSDTDALLAEASQVVTEGWASIQCTDKAAAVDVGEEWLFFPKSGYNPNVADLFIYHSVGSMESWQASRGLHNISFTSDANGGHAAPVVAVHSREIRRPSHR